MSPEQEAQQAQTIAEIKDDVKAYETVLGKNEHTKKYRALLEIVDSQAQKIAEQAKELKLLRYVLEAEKTARVYEDGTGAAGEALFHARKELEDYDAKMTPKQTTDSKEVPT